MKIINWIWSRMDGIKTFTGALLHALWFIYYIRFDKTISFEHQLTGHGIVGLITGVGLGHKIVKLGKQSKNGNNG